MDRAKLRHVNIHGARPACCCSIVAHPACTLLNSIQRIRLNPDVYIIAGFKSFHDTDVGPLNDFTCIIGCNGYGKRSACSILSGCSLQPAPCLLPMSACSHTSDSPARGEREHRQACTGHDSTADTQHVLGYSSVCWAMLSTSCCAACEIASCQTSSVRTGSAAAVSRSNVLLQQSVSH